MANEDKEKGGTKKCKSCQTEIPEKAKKCPNCQTDLRNWFMRHPIITGILVIFMLMVVFSGSGEETPKTEKVQEAASETSVSKTEEVKEDKYSVGDVIAMENWRLIVNNVKKVKSYGYSTPKTGKEYVIVNVTINNQGDEEKQYIGSGDFKVQDSKGLIVGSDYVGLDDSLESYFNLAPGGEATGSIAFEVPIDDTGLKLIFQPNFLIDKNRIVIDLQ